MTRKTDKVTKAGAVELSEDALDQASGAGGVPYIKFNGDSEVVQKVNPAIGQDVAIKFNPTAIKF